MLSAILIIAGCTTVVAGLGLVPLLLPPHENGQFPQSTDPPLEQLDKLGPTRIRMHRDRLGNRTIKETIHSEQTGQSYLKTTTFQLPRGTQVAPPDRTLHRRSTPTGQVGGPGSA